MTVKVPTSLDDTAMQVVARRHTEIKGVSRPQRSCLYHAHGKKALTRQWRDCTRLCLSSIRLLQSQRHSCAVCFCFLCVRIPDVATFAATFEHMKCFNTPWFVVSVWLTESEAVPMSRLQANSVGYRSRGKVTQWWCVVPLKCTMLIIDCAWINTAASELFENKIWCKI